MPDARGGFGSEQRSVVLSAVAKAYETEENRSDCNKFVKAVIKLATRGKVTLPDDANANGIYELIKNAPWSVIGVGQNAVSIAGVMAAHEGKLVVAAWKDPSGGHGHCAIVLDFTNSKTPPQPESSRHIGELMQRRSVIAQGKLNMPEAASEYMKISAGFSTSKLDATMCSYIDIA